MNSQLFLLVLSVLGYVDMLQTMILSCHALNDAVTRRPTQSVALADGIRRVLAAPARRCISEPTASQ